MNILQIESKPKMWDNYKTTSTHYNSDTGWSWQNKCHLWSSYLAPCIVLRDYHSPPFLTWRSWDTERLKRSAKDTELVECKTITHSNWVPTSEPRAPPHWGMLPSEVRSPIPSSFALRNWTWKHILCKWLIIWIIRGEGRGTLPPNTCSKFHNFLSKIIEH
jgi:hypothetical protein